MIILFEITCKQRDRVLYFYQNVALTTFNCPCHGPNSYFLSSQKICDVKTLCQPCDAKYCLDERILRR